MLNTIYNSLNNFQQQFNISARVKQARSLAQSKNCSTFYINRYGNNFRLNSAKPSTDN